MKNYFYFVVECFKNAMKIMWTVIAYMIWLKVEVDAAAVEPFYDNSVRIHAVKMALK